MTAYAHNFLHHQLCCPLSTSNRFSRELTSDGVRRTQQVVDNEMSQAQQAPGLGGVAGFWPNPSGTPWEGPPIPT